LTKKDLSAIVSTQVEASAQVDLSTDLSAIVSTQVEASAQVDLSTEASAQVEALAKPESRDLIFKSSCCRIKYCLSECPVLTGLQNVALRTLDKN
jgi:hypothetical protein